MAEGLLQRLPNLEELLQQQATARGQLEALIATFTSLEPASAGSPLGPVGSMLVELDARLDIDVSDLEERFPATLEVIRSAMPPAAVEYVEAIEDTYSAARSFLRDNPLAREAAAGRDLQEVALAVIEEALDEFNRRLGELTADLIDPATLQAIRDAFAAIEEFRTDFSSHQDEFLPFFTYYLLGVQPNFLRDPLAHLEASYAVLAPLAEEALGEALEPANASLAAAFDEFEEALEAFDPADASAYAELRLRLDGLDTPIRAVVAAATPVYAQLQTLVESHAWDEIFSTYRMLLQTITVERPFTVGSITDEMAELLEDMLARFHTDFGAEELTRRIDTLSSIVHDTFAASPLWQMHQTIRDFLEEIEDAIESVPTEEIQRTVEGMLERVGQELEALGIARIEEEIQNALGEAQEFVVENFDEALTESVQAALQLVLSNVKSLGLDNMISKLTAAVAQLDDLVSKLEEALDKRMDAITELLSRLDALSYKPLSDEVIAQIDELRTRLLAINPNALSDAERFALRLALAFLEDIDLEDYIASELKKAYHDAEDRVEFLLEEISASLEQLRDAFEAFSPEQVLDPVNEGLKKASDGVRRLNRTNLMRPLHEQLNLLVKRLQSLSPGALLDGLQEPYDSMMQAVGRLDPARWVAPLKELYEQIEGLIDVVDVTSLLYELDRRQGELFANIRAALIASLDEVDLPEPLNGFFAGIRPVLEEMMNDLFADPGSELRRLGNEVNTQLSVGRLSEPLDEAFDDLVSMVESVPEDELTDAVNEVREALGVGLAALDPDEVIRRFRDGQARLVQIDPRRLLGRPLRLPELKLAFEVRAEAAPPERQADILAVSARFDAVISLVTPEVDSSLIRPLIEAHDTLTQALGRKIDALDASGASAAYDDLRESLDGLLPAFLRSPNPLTHDEIMAGLRAMRPSLNFERVEAVLERFMQRIEPLGEALEPAIDRMFDGIREVLMLVNPLELKDAVEDIYEPVRAKVRILDPEALADSIRENVFGPVTEALEGINPAVVKGEIDEAYRETLEAVSGEVKKILDEIAAVLETELGSIRDELLKLIAEVQKTISEAGDAAEAVADRLEQLIFVDLLQRLKQVIENLGVSFDRELDRVRNAFDEMLAAVPVGSSGASGGVAA